MHHPIQLQSISCYFSNHICFEDFSATIHAGNRIGIIGRNGSGKSSLLKILLSEVSPSSGKVFMPDSIWLCNVPQIIPGLNSLSGGQKFNQKLTQALSQHPDVLVLDEPTNHLDAKNRRSLFKLLKYFSGTLIIASHDEELLENQVDHLWHIDQGDVIEFKGRYSDYQQKRNQYIQALRQEKETLSSQKEQLHEKRMREQTRSSKSSAKGKKSIQNRKWPTVVSRAKASRASNTAGKKMYQLTDKQDSINEKLKGLSRIEIIKPTFGISSSPISPNGTCVSIRNGSVSYDEKIILSEINLSVSNTERLAIAGKNGSGKSTLLKAILRDDNVNIDGEWYAPTQNDIGCLDQHYQILSPEETVLETIETLVPSWDHNEVRQHLSTYLFRKNEQVNIKTKLLSGGEKARLCLAKIAAQPPKLLILDEVTNNLDIETKEHIIQILKAYPGAMIVVSHDEKFLNEINIDLIYDVFLKKQLSGKNS